MTEEVVDVARVMICDGRIKLINRLLQQWGKEGHVLMIIYHCDMQWVQILFNYDDHMQFQKW